MRATTTDLLVVGLGAVGSAALYQAAKRGLRVAGIDRFAPPHAHGSSHGDTRVTREAIGEGDEYVPFVRRSHQTWDELEAQGQGGILTRCGVLYLASAGVTGAHHGQMRFVEQTVRCARTFGIDHERLDAAQVRERFPQFALTGDEHACFEPGGGFVRPERAIRAQLALAQRLGATVHVDETVRSLRASGASTEVVTDRGVHRADRVILAAGAWLPDLLPPPLRMLFNVQRQALYWFDVAGAHDAFVPGRFPVFIWTVSDGPDGLFYGFPAIDGPAGGIKLAAEQEAPPDAEPTDAEAASMHARYVESRLPGIGRRCLRRLRCPYTMAPGSRFVVDRHPDLPGAWFASACSGHGFKHSAGIAEALVQQAIGEAPFADLETFSIEKISKAHRLQS
jgi:sarcosine oxidase